MRFRRSMLFAFIFLASLFSAILPASAAAQSSSKVVKVSLGDAAYKVKRGAAIPVSVVLNIDSGYHINSNRPAEQFLIATALKLERVTGISTTPVVYPKARLQKFAFSPKPMSIFDGKTVLKFTARALTAAAVGQQTLKGKLTVQACNEEQCLRPETVEVSIPIEVM